MKGERETIISEQRGKDLNVSGRSYDKHTEVGDRARISGRKERIVQRA